MENWFCKRGRSAFSAAFATHQDKKKKAEMRKDEKGRGANFGR